MLAQITSTEVPITVKILSVSTTTDYSAEQDPFELSPQVKGFTDFMSSNPDGSAVESSNEMKFEGELCSRQDTSGYFVYINEKYTVFGLPCTGSGKFQYSTTITITDLFKSKPGPYPEDTKQVLLPVKTFATYVAGSACKPSPIIVDVANNGYQLTDTDSGVLFDFSG